MDPENNEESQGHPAWQDILSEIPDDLHGLIKPKLEKWDQGVQGKLQDIRNQYDPYKDLIDNKVDPALVQQSLYIANQLQNDPNAFVQKAIETFGLDYVQQALANQQDDDDDEPDYSNDLGYDITEDPRYKALEKTVSEMSNRFQEQDQETQAQTQARELEEYLDTLTEDNKDKGEFDRLYVTALMANGVKGEDAVQQFYNTVNQAAARIANGGQIPNTQQVQQTNQQAPVIMGAEGGSGSGSAAEPVRLGDMKTGQIQDLVMEMINKSNQG